MECRYNTRNPGPNVVGTSGRLTSMIQKIEVVMKKMWYVKLVVDNKNYYRKGNQFISTHIRHNVQAIEWQEVGFLGKCRKNRSRCPSWKRIKRLRYTIHL